MQKPPADLLAMVDELEKLARRGPGADPDALQRVRTLVNAMRPDASPYGREKLGGLLSRFEILCSARKFERYPGGADGVKIEILDRCKALRSPLAWAKDAE